jgi:hypothetical protein
MCFKLLLQKCRGRDDEGQMTIDNYRWATNGENEHITENIYDILCLMGWA